MEGTLWRRVVAFIKQDNIQFSLEHVGEPCFKQNMSKEEYSNETNEMCEIG